MSLPCVSAFLYHLTYNIRIVFFSFFAFIFCEKEIVQLKHYVLWQLLHFCYAPIENILNVKNCVMLPWSLCGYLFIDVD